MFIQGSAVESFLGKFLSLFCFQFKTAAPLLNKFQYFFLPLILRFTVSKYELSVDLRTYMVYLVFNTCLLINYSEDFATRSRLEKYLASGDIMRKASLRHASLPCSPLQSDVNDEEVYYVESTGASVTLNSSVGLIYFYCSRLPSDWLVYSSLLIFISMLLCMLFIIY
jgi:hypothetical protein